MESFRNLLVFILIETRGLYKITFDQNSIIENHSNGSTDDIGTKQNFTEAIGNRMSPILTENENNTHPIMMCIVLLLLSVIVLYVSVWRPRKKAYIVDAVSPQYIELEEETKMEYCLSFDVSDDEDAEFKSTEEYENNEGTSTNICCGLSNVIAYELQFKRSHDILKDLKST